VGQLPLFFHGRLARRSTSLRSRSYGAPRTVTDKTLAEQTCAFSDAPVCPSDSIVWFQR